MNRLVLALSMVILAFGIGAPTLDARTVSGSVQDSTSTLRQQHSFGTIVRGSTVCVGPLSPTTAPDGSVSSQSAPTLVFQTTARFVDTTIPPSGNFLFHACVVKSAQAAQDYDLTLNSFPVE